AGFEPLAVPIARLHSWLWSLVVGVYSKWQHHSSTRWRPPRSSHPRGHVSPYTKHQIGRGLGNSASLGKRAVDLSDHYNDGDTDEQTPRYGQEKGEESSAQHGLVVLGTV